MRPFRVIRRHRRLLFSVSVVLVLLCAGASEAAAEAERSQSPTVVAETGIDRATGNPHLIRLTGGTSRVDGANSREKALALLEAHAEVYGLEDPRRELQWVKRDTDPMGGEQAIFHQVYDGIPVFGTLLRVHFDAEGGVKAINGSIVSDIDLDPVPGIDAHAAERRARQIVAKRTDRDLSTLQVRPATLMVFRENLVRGSPGANHLAWQVEVMGPPGLHDALYIEAHDGLLLDRRSMIHNLRRVIHLGYMPNPIWSEGDDRPYSTGDAFRDGEINELIDATGDAHSLFSNITGGSYLSYDGADTAMNAIYDSESIDCPNAVESGGVTAYCEGMVSDDVTAHEWAHAYTGWTHGLIYQWQPGALNEAYSDIYGELVDQYNGRGTDAPGGIRPPGNCSSLGGSPQPTLTIDSPSAIAGPYAVGGAAFNPPSPWTVTAQIELADDGTGATSDACEPMVDFTPGAIALIDRGTCLFREKVLNAENVGALGVIIVNNQGNSILEMGGDLPRLNTPAVFLGQADGDVLKAALAGGVTATLDLSGDLTDSVRWLIGEDTSALGAIRDMWSPVCFGDPDRVSSVNYHCRETDNGGVHTNSGIANHAFALLVDGGNFNGRRIEAIGATKAARIYWRAMSVYQTPVTGYPAHADLLETSCRDLIGATLYDPMTGNVAFDSITGADCDQIAVAMEAVEMRVNPDQCVFETLLDPETPTVDGDLVVFSETFDTEPAGWALSNYGVFAEYEARDWVWTDDLPEGGEGGAFFAIDSVLIGDCRPGSDDQSGVMELTSPTIEVPRGTSNPVLTFDHWMASEATWDGGNLKLSINEGPFLEVAGSRFLHNPYNDRITSNGNFNPLAGELAWTGTDEGSLGGSWGQSQIDLRTLAAPGDRIVLRFDLGVDGCNGAVGWYVDNVRVIVTEQSPRHSGGRVAP